MSILKRDICNIQQICEVCRLVFMDKILAFKYFMYSYKYNDMCLYNAMFASVHQEIYTIVIKHVIAHNNIHGKLIDGIIKNMGSRSIINTTILKICIDYNPNVINESCNGYTILMSACKWYRADIVRQLIRVGTNINARDRHGWTALMYACSKGNKEVTDILLHAGADINKANYHGDTALLIACKNNRKEIVSRLIQGGADMNAKNKMGETALQIAWRFNFTDIIYMLAK